MDMKQHDTDPPLSITVTDGTTPVDLSTADLVRVVAARAGQPLFARTVTGTDQGVVTMQWQAGDTDLAGGIDVEVEVTRGTSVRTFPPNGYLRVEVLPDLG